MWITAIPILLVVLAMLAGIGYVFYLVYANSIAGGVALTVASVVIMIPPVFIGVRLGRKYNRARVEPGGPPPSS